jgi:uncharacterized protein
MRRKKSNKKTGALSSKLAALERYLMDLPELVIAFSGGTDSAFLLECAFKLKPGHVTAFIEANSLYPDAETEEAVRFCKRRKIPYHVERTDVLSLGRVVMNPPDRCYYCKSHIFTSARAFAKERNAVVLDGTNLDDVGDYRPGLKALEELGIKSPLKDCGLTKTDIRIASRKAGLLTWNKPSMACLASRFPTGVQIDEGKLKMVARAEAYLWKRKFSQLRVRWENGASRIELLPREMNRLMKRKVMGPLVGYFRSLGFSGVYLDLEGYRMGSVNHRTLELRNKGSKDG